ncbi:hypothetical protein FRC11_013783 [Ceratobasidium sp. 423]|nr:hypothetical protein FRC11_013783 [Ceratobasidium sp. 423]
MTSHRSADIPPASEVTIMLFYTVPASAMTWYKYSLSYALHRVAQSGTGIIPRALSSALEEAGSQVFNHESYFNEMYAGTHAPHPDPMFVYNGYLAALTNLFKLVNQPVRGYDDAHIYMEIKGHLQSILSIAHFRCMNQVPLNLPKDQEWNIFLADFIQVLKP